MSANECIGLYNAVSVMLKKLLDMLYRVLDLNEYRLNASTTATAVKEGGANNVPV